MAGDSAASGTATKTPTMKRWNVEVGSSSRSGRDGRSRVLGGSPDGSRADAGMVGDVARPAVVASTALTVLGDVVIVLLWVSEMGQERLYAYVTVAYSTVG